jgi:hypothetical protein
VELWMWKAVPTRPAYHHFRCRRRPNATTINRYNHAMQSAILASFGTPKQ